MNSESAESDKIGKENTVKNEKHENINDEESVSSNKETER